MYPYTCSTGRFITMPSKVTLVALLSLCWSYLGQFLNPAGLLCILGLMLLAETAAQPQYEQLTVEHGLSQGYVTEILEDQEGFLWFGTRVGLNRYDGRRFRRWMHHHQDSSSLAANQITALAEYQNYLIVGSYYQGLQVYDKTHDQFLRFQSDTALDSTLHHRNISDVTVAGDTIWLLIRQENEDNIVVCTQWSANEQGPELKLLFSRRIRAARDLLSIPEKQELWVGGHQGLQRWRWQQQTWDTLLLATGGLRLNNLTYLPTLEEVWGCNAEGNIICFGDSTYYLTVDFTPRFLVPNPSGDGVIISSRSHGVRQFSIRQRATKLNYADGKLLIPPEVGQGGVLRLDRSGILWVGTSGHGIVKYNARAQRFQSLFYGSSIPKYFLVDRKGHIGFNTSVQFTRTFNGPPEHHYRYFTDEPKTGDHLLLDPQGQEWLVSPQLESTKLYLFNEEQLTWNLVADLPFGRATINALTTTVNFAADGKLWLARYDELQCYDPKTQVHKRFSYAKHLPKLGRVLDLQQTADGRWWIATRHGLLAAKIEGDTASFDYYSAQGGPNGFLPNDYISTLLPDPDRDSLLWIGTLNGGFCQMHIRKKSVRYFNNRTGFPNNSIYGMLPDDCGSIWISTNAGLVQFDPRNETYRQYTQAEGLPSNEFNSRAYHKLADGSLLFGSVKGAVLFRPQDFVLNQWSPPLRITDLKVNNQRWQAGRSITFTKAIELSYKQNDIAIEFVGLEYSLPAVNRYRYYLEGAEAPWSHEDTEGRANYLNLRPGQYRFWAIASNSDGVWHPEATALSIRIRPPWWQSTLAYLLYGLLFLGFLTGLIWLFLYRQGLKYQIIAEQQEKQNLRELNKIRTELYANLTHEFRTPLTIINGLSSELERKSSGVASSAIGAIRRNGEKMLRLINHLLQLNELEQNIIPLQPVGMDLVAQVRHLLLSYQSLAEQRGLRLELQTSLTALSISFDHDYLDTILGNILSNALKFTPAGGQVMIDIDELADEQYFQIRITDTGKGIAKDELEHIFKRFYRSSSEQESSGIGLAYVKALVERVNGSVQVKSTLGQGSCFILKFPKLEPEVSSMKIPFPKESPSQHSARKNLPQLLIAEDNGELMQYLVSCVSDQYRILTANDGQAGIEQAIDKVPDIIISDVMMPRRSGFELVSELKADHRTSHIPIVLLTGKSDRHSRYTGLEYGADDYLAKPFDPYELRLRLRNLMRLQERWREKYGGGIWLRSEAKDPETNFLLRLQQLFAQNIADENFGIQDLCKALGVSRTQLHNKLKALTGDSTSIYLRKLRLQRAQELLLNTQLRVGEITAQCGFRYRQHFTNYYTEFFGETPTQTRQRH